MTLEDKFLIGSCGKAFTATLAAILINEELLQWDTSVGEVFPEIKMHELKDALIDLPQKIVQSAKSNLIYTTQIRYSDIDLNQHANNASYIKFMLDCFDKDFHKEHTIKSLVVSFSAESKFGDEIQLYKATENDIPLTHYIETKNQTSSKMVFQAIVEWN